MNTYLPRWSNTDKDKDALKQKCVEVHFSRPNTNTMDKSEANATDHLLSEHVEIYGADKHEDGETNDEDLETLHYLESSSKSTGEKILQLAVPALGALLIDPIMVSIRSF